VGELLRRYGFVLRRNPHGGGAEVGVREVMAAAAVARFTAETFAAELRDLDSDDDDEVEGDEDGDEEEDDDDDEGDEQGLTLFHFSAQPEPFLTQNTRETP
jgi:SET domain-containing protein 6